MRTILYLTNVKTQHDYMSSTYHLQSDGKSDQKVTTIYIYIA